MKINRFFIVAMFIFIFQMSTFVQAQTWKITSLDWQPYSGSAMANQGNSIEKLRTLLKAGGITLIVEFYPWERAQALARTKEYVGYFPAWPEEVDQGFIASEPVDSSNIGLLVNSDSSVVWKDFEDLFKNYTVGLVSTYEYPESIKQAAKKYSANVSFPQDEIVLLRMLMGKRFDVAITDPAVMMYLAQLEGIKTIKVLNKSIMAKPLVVAFRVGDDNKGRLDILNNLLKKK